MLIKILSLIVGFLHFIYLSNSQKPCTTMNLKSNIIRKGMVNVIYLMSYNCEFCYIEAQQLPLLEMEMFSKGININTIIAVDSKAEKVSAHVPGVTVDSPEIWTTLGQHNGHIFVIDKCNKLTYEVIMPWSHHRNPFVKAAILSAYHSQPCGPCSLRETLLKNKKHYDYKKTTGILQYPPINSRNSHAAVIVTSDDDDDVNSSNIPPMRIIFSQKHTHQDNPNVFNYIELLADEPSYHKHPEDENEYFFGTSNIRQTNKEEGNDKPLYGTNENKLVYDDDSNKSVGYTNQLTTNDDHQYNNGEFPIENKKQNASSEIMTKEKLWSHYCNILLWLPHV